MLQTIPKFDMLDLLYKSEWEIPLMLTVSLSGGLQAEGDGGVRALGELPSLRLTLSLLVGGDATRRTGARLGVSVQGSRFRT